MHEGKYLKELIESQKLKKKDVAKSLGISPQLLQGYFRSERLQDATKSEIKEKLGIEIKTVMYKNVNEPPQEYSPKDDQIQSLKKEIEYLQKINDINLERIKEKNEVIELLKEQLPKKE